MTFFYDPSSPVAHLSHIFEGLYLGGHSIARDTKWLLEHKIKVVINVAKEVKKNDLPGNLGIEYHAIGLIDDAKENMANAFTTRRVQQLLLDCACNAKPVLLHCHEGRSRYVLTSRCSI